MNLQEITPVILTLDEEPNLRRTLEGLQWASQIVVLDSHSQDATQTIAQSFPNVRLELRRFDSHTEQWNYGVSLATTPWVLALDADYGVPPALESELRALDPTHDTDAYFASFLYCIFGRALRAALYPPRAVLFRSARCTYVEDGHTQLLKISGGHGRLRTPLLHDDRKPLSRWLLSQDGYARQEAAKLETRSSSDLPLQDKLRKLFIPAPLLTLVYCLLFKGLILDGWRGWYYTWQRVLAELLLSIRLLEVKICGSSEAANRKTT